jgi:hypothetical protein
VKLALRRLYCMLRNMFKILDKRENEIGAANRDNVQRMLESFAIFPFTERLGWVNLSYELKSKLSDRHNLA